MTAHGARASAGNSPALVTRLATAADLPAIVALTAAAYAVYDLVLDAPAVPVTEDYAPRVAAGEVWLLEERAEPVGLPVGLPMGLPAGLPMGLIVLETHKDHLMIFSVAVAPGQQGRGVGRRLLEFADARARAAGLAELRLYTNAKMMRNIALYTRYGYRETGRRANPLRPGWVRVDMTRTLTDAPA